MSPRVRFAKPRRPTRVAVIASSRCALLAMTAVVFQSHHPRHCERSEAISPPHSESKIVMAGLVPAIHAFLRAKQGVDARHKAGHDVGESCAQISTSSSSRIILSPYMRCCVRERCRAAHPGGFPFQLSVSNPSPLQQRVAERRNSQPRNAAPVGSPCGRTHPVCETGLPAHNACRRASRRPTAAFSLDPGIAFWKRTGAPFTTALDSTGFPPLSSAPPARCRTDPCSWAGRCLPRPPEAWLTRPNPQAPHPTPPTSATGWRPLLSRTDQISSW
jgi:hypothetical protein